MNTIVPHLRAMSIRDHLSADVRAKLKAKDGEARQPRHSQPDLTDTTKSSLKRMGLLLRVMGLFVMVVILLAVVDPDIWSKMMGGSVDPLADEATDPVLQDGFYRWIPITVIVIIGIASMGALIGLLVARLRSRSADGFLAQLEADSSPGDESAR